MKTYVEVIEETVEYYKTNPRAIENGDCQYINDSGAMCAIGRCAKDPEELEQLYHGGAIDSLLDNIVGMHSARDKKTALMNEVLKAEYRHLDDIEFWRNLQTYHDSSYHWKYDFEENKLELTDLGIFFRDKLIIKYKGK